MLQQEAFSAATPSKGPLTHLCDLYITLQSDFAQIMRRAPWQEGQAITHLTSKVMGFRENRYALAFQLWELRRCLREVREGFEAARTPTAHALASKQAPLEEALSAQLAPLDGAYMQKFIDLIGSYFWESSSPRVGWETQAFLLQIEEPSKKLYREMQRVARTLAVKLASDEGWARVGAEEECRERFLTAFDALEVQYLLGKHDG